MRKFSEYVPEYISVRTVMAKLFVCLCVLSAWLLGGIYAPLQWLLVLTTVLLFSGMFFLNDNHRRKAFYSMLRDPLFTVGLLFIGILIVQWVNSNHWIIEMENGTFDFESTPSHWLPWSVKRAEASEMFVWFVPPIFIVLITRNLFSGIHILTIMRLLIFNAALLGFIGITQSIFGSKRILGIWNVSVGEYYATFDYVNHAAAWFYLSAFLSAGMLHRAIIRKKTPIRLLIWTVCFLTCVVSTFLTLSRLGAVISIGLLVVAALLFIKRILKSVPKGKRLNLYLCIAILGITVITLFLGAGKGRLALEMKETVLVADGGAVEGDLSGRIYQISPAIDIIREYPVFGSGAWGYRWLVPMNLTDEDREFWESTGKANIHCDPIQFVSEFGFIGFSLLMGFVITLFVSARGIRDPMPIWILTGTVCVCIHSVIDLPFRNPAILYLWSFLLGSLSHFKSHKDKKVNN